MSIVKQGYTQISYPAKFSEMNESLYTKMHTEVEHLSSRCFELTRQNEELMQKSQVVVKKLETNIVENRTGMDHVASERISELEARLDETEFELKMKIKEIEELQIYVTRCSELETKVGYLHEEKEVVQLDLCDRIREIEALQNERVLIEQINQKNILIINDKNREIEELYRRIEELELLPPLFKQAKQDIQFLNSEIERFTLLVRERDTEILSLRRTVEVLKGETCFAPAEHDELRIRIAEVHELKDKVLAIPTLQELIVVLEAEIKRLQAAFAESESLNQTYSLKISDLVRTIDVLNEALALRDITITELEQYKSRSIIEMERIRVEAAEKLMFALGEKDLIINNLSLTIENMKQEMFILNQEIVALKNNYEILVLERDNLLKILNTRDSQISILTEANARKDEQLCKYTTEFDMASKKISCLENELSNLKTQLSLALTDSQGLHIRIGELEEYKRHYEAVVIDRDAKILEIREFTLLNARLVSDIEVLRSELISLKTKFEDLQVHLHQITQERDLKIVELRDLYVLHESMIAKITQYEIDLRDRNRTISELTASLNEAQIRIVSFSKTVEVLEHDNHDLEIKLEAARSENHRLLETVRVMTTEKEHLLTLVDQRDSLIAALNKDVVRLTDENRHLNASLISVQEKCDGLSAILHEREIEIEKLKAIVDRTSLEFDALKNRTNYALTEFDKLEKLTRDQGYELSTLREQLSRLHELKDRVEDLTLQNAHLKEQLAEIPSLRAEVVRIQQQVYAAVTEKDRLIEFIREKDEEISNFRFVSREYEELRLRFKESEEEVTRLSGFLTQRESYLKELESKIINLESILDSQRHMVIENERLGQEVPMLISRIHTLEQTLTVTNDKYLKLENLYREIRGVTEHLGEVHEKLVETVDQTEKVNESLKATAIYHENTTVTDKYVHEPTVQRF